MIKDLKPSLNDNVGSEKLFLYYLIYFPADFYRSVYYQFFAIVLIRFQSFALALKSLKPKFVMASDLKSHRCNIFIADYSTPCMCRYSKPHNFGGLEYLHVRGMVQRKIEATAIFSFIGMHSIRLITLLRIWHSYMYL